MGERQDSGTNLGEVEQENEASEARKTASGAVSEGRKGLVGRESAGSDEGGR